MTNEIQEGVIPIIWRARCHIKIWKLQWGGHIGCRVDRRIPRNLLKAKVEGKRPPGEPRNSWKGSVSKTSYTLFGLRNSRAPSLDRDEWRQRWSHLTVCHRGRRTHKALQKTKSSLWFWWCLVRLNKQRKYVFINAYKGREEWKELLRTGGGLRTIDQVGVGSLKSR